VNKVKKRILIGCGSVFGLLILMVSCVAIIAENTVYIDMDKEFKADKDGTVKIKGKTNPGATVRLYQGSLFITKDKANDKGSFLLKITADPNTKTKYQVKASDGDVSEEKDITVIGPKIPTIKLDVPSFKTTKDQSTLKGTTEPGAKVTLKQDNKVISTKTADSNGDFSFTVKTDKDKSFTVSSKKEGFISDSSTVKIKRVLSKAEQKARYKNSCKEIPYKQLKKNPERYAGEKYKARGKILQIMEGLGQTEMRIAVTKDRWGYWDFNDVVYVTYEGITDFVEEDVVTIYGEITGSHTYTSVAGWTITVPSVDVKYIEK